MGALAEAYKHSLLDKQPIPLDYGSVRTLPESHIWLDQSDESPYVAYSTSPISPPVIDLTDPDAPRLIIQACETWGVFQLIGHDIPTKLMEDVESEAGKLFGLPVDQKLKALRSPGGGAGYGLPHISPFFNKCMWHEGFTIMGSPIDHTRQLWPQAYQGFCETMVDYQNQLKALTEQLIRIIFKSLNINSEEVDWLKDSQGSSTALQLNSYPACPDPTRAMGLAPHTDTSLITILQSKTSGLQVFKEGAGWILVQPIPGALIVNVGDFLHILSNGVFTTVRHRVVVTQIQRFSAAHFYAPPGDVIVSPVMSKDFGEVPRYRSVSVKGYVETKGKHFEKALSLIKK
ncbi:gibberellin 3-beta-dioxygenase 1-like [Prunus avium]|uniref:Gibberellin 3-beta-dioxygenase 1-like n=1 Tax=Prunus avium TaxID=42229 RepID=A0A6P5TD67_PRUAV|nr:gibberellin 3-beta-dioxygenase 1-like [Prunus avium]